MSAIKNYYRDLLNQDDNFDDSEYDYEQWKKEQAKKKNQQTNLKTP